MGNTVAVMAVRPMGRINVARVIIGGIVAGLVINVSEFVLNQVVLVSDMTAALSRMNLPPIGGSAIPMFILLGFVGGIATVWLYAAMRPRFGPGPSTGAIAGLVVWFFGYFYGGVALYAMGIFPARLMAISLGWGLGESIIAALAGSALYTEG
jgi:hypothetical protein